MKKFIKILLSTMVILGLFTACSNDGANNPGVDNGEQSSAVNVTVGDILDAIKTAYGEDYLPNMEIPAEMIESEFGLTSDMYEEVKAEQPMIGTHADRVVVVKAQEGKADDVESALLTAKENKIKDTFQYPMNVAKISASKVVRHGDYISFLLVGAINEDMDANEEEAKEFAEKEVQKGVDAINDLFK